MVEVIYRNSKTPEQRLRNELGNVTSRVIPSQTTVTLNSTRTTTNLYERGYQTTGKEKGRSLLNEP
jgi:hypothetical protein